MILGRLILRSQTSDSDSHKEGDLKSSRILSISWCRRFRKISPSAPLCNSHVNSDLGMSAEREPLPFT